jgi:hypothetical protein
MRYIVKLFIIAVGMLLVAGGVAWAADVTETAGAAITGTSRCEISISTGSLSVTAPTGAGPSTTSFSPSSVSMEIMSNNVSSDSWYVQARISSTLPDQYGQSKTYSIIGGDSSSGGSFTASADSDWTSGDASSFSGIFFTDTNQIFIESYNASGSVVHGTVTQSIDLAIYAGKRMYGDTSDSVTLQYTFVD